MMVIKIKEDEELKLTIAGQIVTMYINRNGKNGGFKLAINAPKEVGIKRTGHGRQIYESDKTLPKTSER